MFLTHGKLRAYYRNETLTLSIMSLGNTAFFVRSFSNELMTLMRVRFDTTFMSKDGAIVEDVVK